MRQKVNIGLIVFFIALITAGCLTVNPPEQQMPFESHENYFTSLWDTTLNNTGVDASSAHFQKVWFDTDEQGNITSLLLLFTGKKNEETFLYHIEINPIGMITTYHSKIEDLDGEIVPVNPGEVLKEMDTINYTAFTRNATRLSVRCIYKKMNAEYAANSGDLFILRYGSFIPIKRIIFDEKNPYCLIDICKIDQDAPPLLKNESVEEQHVSPYLSPGRCITVFPFLWVENSAKSVLYFKNT
jgi:hypothetical protein